MSKKTHQAEECDPTEAEEGWWQSWQWHVYFLGTAVIIGLVWYLYTDYQIRRHGEGAAGFGDAHGAVNALFSGTALAGVVVALFMQRAELRLQRRDLAMTRGVINDQKLQMEFQSREMARSNDDAVFMALYERAKSALETVEYSDRRGVSAASSAWEFAFNMQSRDAFLSANSLVSGYLQAMDLAVTRAVKSPAPEHLTYLKSWVSPLERRLIWGVLTFDYGEGEGEYGFLKPMARAICNGLDINPDA